MGKVKTRLTPQYSLEQATFFHQICIQQVWTNLKQLQNQTSALYHIDRFLSISEDHPLWATLLEEKTDDLFVQPSLDLGDRMTHAFQTCFSRPFSFSNQTDTPLNHQPQDLLHYDQVILLGTDSPTLPLSYLEKAIERLSDAWGWD